MRIKYRNQHIRLPYRSDMRRKIHLTTDRQPALMTLQLGNEQRRLFVEDNLRTAYRKSQNFLLRAAMQLPIISDKRPQFISRAIHFNLIHNLKVTEFRVNNQSLRP